MTEVKKLDIGSGSRPHEGFTTLDIEPSSGAEIVGDFRTMSFENLEEIRAHHILEHFSRKESTRVLKQWRSWLQNGGLLTIEVPNYEEACKLFADANKSYKYWLCRHTYGSQEADWAFHKNGWWPDKLVEKLQKIGFEIIFLKTGATRVIRKKDGVKNVYKMPNIYVIAKKITRRDIGLVKAESFSQEGEDNYIVKYFQDFVGNFLDIGANDGITFSNSYRLLRRGWGGVLIEPSPKAFGRLKQNLGNNPKANLFQYAITDKEGKCILHESGALLSKRLKGQDVGLISTIKDEELLRWDKWKGRISWQDVEVDCRTFASFLNESPIKTFDFITIDTEGEDFNILKQIDLNRIGCKAICIEYIRNEDRENIKTYIEAQGYKLLVKTKYNLIFVK